ncbi:MULTISPECIES: DsbA family protein [Streptomyces]|uniref:Protein-disulfide isomerase n=1 Tax=Streptomyces clavifer TaxID=68188 RepID=A0ABS4VD90_9ACTN|nr:MULTISPECIES: DsbA family protein [Streptomyces]MBP2361881.1 protein-disulfide isomerase [Streptomyces clavifer]MDX2748226.1 DsbA family protein [Streptomyces sp. NRRL_B-2557]GHB14955.1 DSBA oxidoreductase [Streptomyces clavifer]
MSNRNSQANKSAARERLRVERERQVKKDKARKQVVVAVSVVGVLAVVGAIAFGVAQLNKPSAWEAAADAKNVTAPKNTSGDDGTTVVIGESSAKKTLELYEDSRCPICATFEQSVGETIAKDVEAGKYKIKYVGATFIDNTDNGEGSKNALSALGAALDVSPEAFLDYKAALHSAKYHPQESEDKFAKDDYLVEVADSVDALKGNAAFKKDVEDGTYDAWAVKMSKAFDKSGVQGTPTLKMDGKKVTAEGSENAPMTEAEYAAAITKALKG